MTALCLGYVICFDSFDLLLNLVHIPKCRSIQNNASPPSDPSPFAINVLDELIKCFIFSCKNTYFHIR